MQIGLSLNFFCPYVSLLKVTESLLYFHYFLYNLFNLCICQHPCAASQSCLQSFLCYEITYLLNENYSIF